MMVTECAVMSYTFSPADAGPRGPAARCGNRLFVWGLEHHHVTEWDDETDGLCRSWPDLHNMFYVLGRSYWPKKQNKATL